MRLRQAVLGDQGGGVRHRRAAAAPDPEALQPALHLAGSPLLEGALLLLVALEVKPVCKRGCRSREGVAQGGW